MMRTVYNLLKLLRLTLVSSAPSSSTESLLGTSVESRCGAHLTNPSAHATCEHRTHSRPGAAQKMAL